MKRKSIAILLSVVLMLVIMLTACNCKKHKFSSEWKYDDTSHWHECLKKKHSDVADKAEHTFNEGVVTTAPTETSEGVLTLTCTVCGYQKTKSIEKVKHVHTFNDKVWQTDENNHWHPATCAHTDEKGDTAAHTFDEGRITVEATEDTDGEKVYICTVCKYEKKEVIPQLDHTHKFDMTSWKYDGKQHWHPSTCGHDLAKDGTADHTFSEWTVKTVAGYGVNRVDQRDCTVCGFHEEKTIEGTLIPPKEREITVGAIDFTFDGTAKSIDTLVTVTNTEGGITIKYCLDDENDNWTDTAPVNAGNYKYKITLNGTMEWAHKEKVDVFTIKKFAINLDKELYEINKDEKLEGGLFGVTCVEVAAETNSYTDWVTVLAPEENNVPGRHVINVVDLTTDEDNFTVKANTETITFVVYDTANLLAGVRDVFTIQNVSGVIITTKIAQGTIKVNDEIYNQELGKSLTVKKIEIGRKAKDKATVDDEVSLLVEGATKDEIKTGQMLTKFGTVNNYDKFTIKLRLLTKEEGGRHAPIYSGYKPTFNFTSVAKSIIGTITLPDGVEMFMPGETIEGVIVSFDTKTPGFVGYKFAISEGGKTIGYGEVTGMHFDSTQLTLSDGVATSDNIYLLEGESREYTISLIVAKGKEAKYKFELLNTTDLTMKVYFLDSELTLNDDGEYSFFGTGRPFTVKVVVTANKATTGNLKITKVINAS
mgnify:FL=1